VPAPSKVKGALTEVGELQVVPPRLIREAESPVGTVPVVANALKMSASDARYDRIPALGQDNAAILGELGYDAEAIESLKNEKVI